MKVTQTIFGFDILDPQTGEMIYGHFATQKDAETIGEILFRNHMQDPTDPTESIRRARVIELNKDLTQDEKARLEALQAQYGQVWNTDQMRQDFEVIGFGAPFVVVKRKADGKKGSLEFTHMPRFYFSFQADEE